MVRRVRRGPIEGLVAGQGMRWVMHVCGPNGAIVGGVVIVGCILDRACHARRAGKE